jgi:hypothetical protein
MEDVAPILEHSVDVPVSLDFVWRFRTDVATWNDPPARFILDGSFVDGATGTTILPNQPPLKWHVCDVRIAEAFTIEMELEGAVLRAEWMFAEVADNRTKMTQRLVLSGLNAASYREQVQSGFGPTLADGMNRIAMQMGAAATLKRERLVRR